MDKSIFVFGLVCFWISGFLKCFGNGHIQHYLLVCTTITGREYILFPFLLLASLYTVLSKGAEMIVSFFICYKIFPQYVLQEEIME